MATMVDHIKEAERLVDEAGLTDDALRPLAFQEVLRRKLAEDPIDGERVPFQRSLVPADPNGANGVGDSKVALIATALGIDPEKVEAVFTTDGDTLGLGVPASCLPTAKSEAARQVAIVVAAANKALGRETRASEVHAILTDYGKIDHHFIEHLNSIAKDILAVKGRPRSKQHELIIRRGGMEEAGRIITVWTDG